MQEKDTSECQAGETVLQDKNLNLKIKFLFTVDKQGTVKQWDHENCKLVQDWGRLVEGTDKNGIFYGGIDSLICNKDGRFLYFFYYQTSSGFHLKHFCVNTRALIKDYGKIHDDGDNYLDRLKISSDGKFLFTYGDTSLKQWEISTEDGSLS